MCSVFLFLQCWPGGALKFYRPTGCVLVLADSVKSCPAGSAWSPPFILLRGTGSPPLLLLPHTGHPAAPLTPAQSWNVPGVSLPSVLPQSLALGTRVPSTSRFLGLLLVSAEAWWPHSRPLPPNTCCFCAQTQHSAGDRAGFDLEFCSTGYLSVRAKRLGSWGSPLVPALRSTLAPPRESSNTH